SRSSLRSHARRRALPSCPTRRSSDLRMALRRVIPAEGEDADQVLAVAGALEHSSGHPIARAIAEAARARTGEPAQVTEFADLPRSEEHTSELQSREKLVCRLPLEKKN